MERRQELLGRGGLQLRVAAALAIVALVLPAVGFAWSRTQVTTALTRRVQEGELATARSVASEIELGVRYGEALALTAARTPGLASSLQSGQLHAVSAVLDDVMGAAPLFARLAVLDPSGSVLAAQPPGVPPPDPSVAGDGSPAVLPARGDGDDAVLPLREPVLGPGGETLAILYAEISFSKAAPGPSALQFGRTGRATVVDSEGRTLLSGERRRAGTTVNAPELQDLVRQWRAGTAEYYSPVLERNEVAAFAPVPGRPFGVFVTQARAEALENDPGLTRGFLAGIAGVAALGLAVALVVGRAAGAYERRLRSELGEQRRLSDALEVFSSRLAHDLKDPLATARLTADVAASRPGIDDDGRRLLAAVTRQLTRAIDLVDDILDLARASGSPRLERLSARPLIEEAAGAAPDLEATYAALPATIEADRVLLRQALVNLLTNASRYGRSPHGAAEVTIGCDESEEGWALWVADRGPGLAENDTETVFHPLERGRRGPDASGTGLGLAIVAAAADAHGGRAWYEPRPGGGAVFWLFLPRPTSRSPAEADATKRQRAPVVSASPRGPTRDAGVSTPSAASAVTTSAAGSRRRFSVIVVDDVADVRDVVRRVLEESGAFEVVAEAGDGAQAVGLVAHHQPDLVLLDISMPVGGLEVLPRIRATAPRTKVIVLSSYPVEAMAPAALAGGAVGYLEKGLPPARLVAEILTIAGLLELVEASIAEARTSLAADPRSAGSARRFVREVLDRWDCTELLDLVTLLVSELVTNAVVHAGTDVDVAVRLVPDAVRVEVTDRDLSLPVPRQAAPGDSSGRGLALIEALASRWGVDQRDDAGGKTLWFEVPRPDLAATA